MKTKVQAQRKFAQGASIPPSQNERRSEITAPREVENKTQNVIRSNVSATHLLDMVSMQKLHQHFQPVVVLKRLNNNASKKSPAPVVPPKDSKEKVQVKTSQNNDTKKKPLKPINKMKLRSRSVARNQTGALYKTASAKRVVAKKQAPTSGNATTVQPVKRGKRTKSPISTEFSTDDDTPLDQITKRPKGSQQSKKLETQIDSTAVEKENKEHNDVNIITPIKVEPKDRLLSPTLAEESATENFYSRKEIEKWLSQSESDTVSGDGDDDTFKVPFAKPLKNVKSLAENKSDIVNRKESSENNPDITGDCTIMSESSSIAILNVMYEAAKPESLAEIIPDMVTGDFDILTKNISLPGSKESKQSVDATSVCTTKTKLSSIIKSSKTNLKGRCRCCDSCAKVDKALTLLTNLLKSVKKHSNGKSTCSKDVYNFDESDTQKEQSISDFRQGRNKDRTNSTDQVQHLYLELPNDSHVIHLITPKYPTQEKTIIKACLIKKGTSNEDLQSETKESSEEMSNEEVKKENPPIVKSPAAEEVPPREAPAPKPSTSGRHPKNMVNHKCSQPNTSGKTEFAPIFYPTEEELENPIAYIEKISPEGSKFGLCKIVPPIGFEPTCHIDDTIRFTAMNQYPAKMFKRWGPATKELSAIKAHLATQKVFFTRPPLVDSLEVDLPKLYHIVQNMGGLRQVIVKGKWQKVAEELKYQKGSLVEKKLDQVYVRYLLPYDTLTSEERQGILTKVEEEWAIRLKQICARSRSPLHKLQTALGTGPDESEFQLYGDKGALAEVEDCVLVGRNMNLPTFEKVARNTMQMYFSDREPSVAAVEQEYWRLVEEADEHVCVNTAAIDTGEGGYGFPKNKNDPYWKHPWNLKVLSNSTASVLRALGPVLSVTVPSLHLGMVFSTSCWHRDPHGLPWIEYMHQGPPKIWYGIPDSQSSVFRKAVETLCPSFCQNKSIWLPSDITMIPPQLLMKHGVTLSKIIQKPGEFIIIFPKAYSSSICTGYTTSESVYFAPASWLHTVQAEFKMVRESFEPTMFPLEQLLLACAADSRMPASVLPYLYDALDEIVCKELKQREALIEKGIQLKEMKHPQKKKTASWNVRQLECDICRTTLHLSKVTGVTDSQSSHCLQHSLLVLDSAPHKDKDKTEVSLCTFYSKDVLKSILQKLKNRL